MVCRPQTSVWFNRWKPEQSDSRLLHTSGPFSHIFSVNVFHLCLCLPLISACPTMSHWEAAKRRFNQWNQLVNCLVLMKILYNSHSALEQERPESSGICMFDDNMLDMCYDIQCDPYIFLLLQKSQTSPLIGFQFSLREKMIDLTADTPEKH